MKDFFTTELLIRLITSFFCSMAFAIVFKINKRHLLFGGLGGFFTYFAYHTVYFFLSSAFAAAYISTVIAALFAEFMARVRKAPTSVFLIPSVIPTVPGSNLYYFMQNLIHSNSTNAISQLVTALSVALGIAGGTVTVSIVFGTIQDKIAKNKAKTKAN